MRLQAQREACMNVIQAAHSLSERVYPALLEIVQHEGPVETPPDFLKAEQAAIRAAVDRLELEGPNQVVPLAHEIIEAARDIDEDCMMEISALKSIHLVAGGFIRISRLFTLSRHLTDSFGEEVTEKIREAIIDETPHRIRESLQPLVDQQIISRFTAHEISTCSWDYLVGVNGGLHSHLDNARIDFAKSAHAYIAEQLSPRHRWSLRRRRNQRTVGRR